MEPEPEAIGLLVPTEDLGFVEQLERRTDAKTKHSGAATRAIGRMMRLLGTSIPFRRKIIVARVR